MKYRELGITRSNRCRMIFYTSGTKYPEERERANEKPWQVNFAACIGKTERELNSADLRVMLYKNPPDEYNVSRNLFNRKGL